MTTIIESKRHEYVKDMKQQNKSIAINMEENKKYINPLTTKEHCKTHTCRRSRENRHNLGGEGGEDYRLGLPALCIPQLYTVLCMLYTRSYVCSTLDPTYGDVFIQYPRYSMYTRSYSEFALARLTQIAVYYREDLDVRPLIIRKVISRSFKRHNQT